MTKFPALATIHDAAKILNVSTKTLRRWESRGVLVPVRTSGGHRRYEVSKIQELKGNRRHVRLSTSFQAPPQTTPTVDMIPVLYQSLHIDQKKILKGIMSFVILSLIIFTAIKATPVLSYLGHLSNLKKDNKTEDILTTTTPEGAVLAANTSSINPTFNINIQSAFKDDSLFTKNVEIDGDLTLKKQIIGNVDLTGVVIVGGNSITTDQSTFNLINTTASTLNIGGAGTAISLGATTGNTTVNNNLNVAGTESVTGKITGSGDLAITGNSTFGNITAIRNITYSFPSAQGSSSTFLTNNGSGTLTWTAPTLTSLSGIVPIGNGGTNNSTAYSAGSIIFSDGTKLTEDNSNLFFDNSNNRVGIGNSAPTVALDVTGGGAFSTTLTANALVQNGFNVCDSSGANCPTAGSGGSKWKLLSGAISPFSDALDVLIGSSATASAKFAFTGVASGTPTASISGTTTNVATYLTGEGNLSTTNMQDLTLGSATTGNVIINSRGSAALTANGANLTTTGTLTLPNTNTITGVANYLQNSQGFSVGGGTTYYFDSSGNINANSGTFAGLLTASNGLTLTTGALNLTSTSGTANLTSTATSGNAYAFTDTSLTSDNSNLALLTFQNANTGAGTLVNGLRIIGSGSTPSSGTNTQNLISLSGTTLGSNTFNGIYFNTGLSNYVNSTNWTVTAAGAETIASDLGVNGGNITTTQTTANIFTNATTLGIGNAAGTTTINGTLAVTGATTLNGNATLGDAITDTLTFSGRVALDSDLVPIGTTGTNDLGTSLLPWDNVYANAFIQNGFNVCDSSGSNCPAGSASLWDSTSGVLYPSNNTLDLLVGASSTASAKFAFTGVNGGLPTASIAGNIAGIATYLTGNGNLATTSMGDLTLGGSTTGNITLNPSNAVAGGFVAPNTTNVTDLGTASLIFRNIYGGTIAGSVLTQGGNAVCDASGANCPVAGSGGSKWRLLSGAITPFTDTLDVLIGSTATTSAKFAFKNVLTGTPTASISGTTANVATYLTGEGNLSTTNFANLTIGSATTGNIIVNPSNSIAGGYIAPTTTNVTDLGTSSSLQFRNVYAQAFSQNGNSVCDTSGNCSTVGNFWQLNNKVISPANSTYDLAIGGTATGSAFQIFGIEQATGNIAKLNSTVITSGNVIEATASAITSGNILKLGQGGAANFTGNAIFADLDNTGGGSFIGNFIRLDNALSTKFTVNSSGSIGVAGGAGIDTITAGTLGIGTATANAVSISISGVTTTVNGTLTSTETLTANNGLTLTTGALNLTSTSAISSLTSTATSGDSFAFTNNSLNTASATLGNFTFKNNNTAGAGLAVNGVNISATGSTPLSGTNTSNLINLSATALASNTFNGINFGNGLTNYINGTNFTVTGAGNVSALGGLTVSGGTINLNYTGTSSTNIGNTTGTTTVAGNILPTTTNSTSLGSSSSLQFNTIYANLFTQNGNNVCDASGANCPTGSSGGSKWKLVGGTISPFTDTLDVLIGSSATTSAKFAFTGVNSGTPTASISGTTANVATYLNGEGNLSTTNMQGLTLGSSTTGNVVINSRGSAALTANGIDLTAGGDLAVNGATSADITTTTTTATLFNATATTLSMGGAAGTLNIGPTGSGASSILLSGGSTDTGCTLDGSNGNLTCSGTISATGITASTVPFSGITNGTNTGAAMIVDTGASLNFSNSGTINASTLLGATWAAPGTIGSGTPNTGAFTTLTTSSTASVSGVLTVGNGTTNTIQSAFGPLNLAYKSGANAWTTGLSLTDTTGDVVIAQDLAVNGGDLTTNQTTATLFNTTATTLSLGGAATTALNLGNGSGNYTAINLGGGAGTHTINIAGTGATAADTINIGTGGTGADTINLGSNASTTALNLTSGTGSQTFASSVVSGATTTSAFVFTGNSLTTGTGMYVNSSSITTGDLMTINSTGTTLTTGNLFRVQNNSSDVFTVGASQITAALPTQFTAAGDVSIAYDLVLTNQTASTIDSYGPLTVRAGESFESNNLTFKTYNSGNVVFDQDVNGKVLIGTGSATLKFTVSNSQAATASAMIENTYNGSDADGLAIKLGYTGNGATTNRFITFLNGVGNTVGRVEATTGLGVAYQTAGIDFAEYFTKDTSTSFDEGDIVSLKDSAAVKAGSENDSAMIGIVSASPGFKGGNEGPDKVLVGLVGQVPLKISSSSDPIKVGDLITSSTDMGRGKKANGAGFIIGKALEAWTGQDKILVYINPTWADPNMSLTASGDIKSVADTDNPGYTKLTDRNGNTISMLSGLTSLLTNSFNAFQGTVDNLLVKARLVSPQVLTREIKPLAGETDVNIKVGTATQSGTLAIKNSNDQVVAGVDSNGNATFSGELTSQSASVAGSIHAGTIYADQIIAGGAKFGDTSTNTLGGISRQQIEDLLNSVQQDQALLNQSQSWSVSTATSSAALNELDLKNLYVTGITALDSLSVTNSITLGSDLAISKVTSGNSSLIAIDTLVNPLSLQSSASQPLYLMAGKVKVDTSGNVQVLGNLAVGGVLSASAVNIAEDPNATISGTINGDVLSSLASAGQAKVASGSADITIQNPNIKVDSLIFVTPTSKVSDTLYVKSQATASATIGFSSTASESATFNWWIVGAAQ